MAIRMAGHELGLTLPEGGLVNQRVQSCARGCLTLKLSLSSKTVTGLLEEAAASVEAEALLPPSGETGMVDRSTCSAILGGWSRTIVARDARG